MSFYVSRNMGPYGTVALGLYDWKEFLKNTGGTKDWNVVASGDGLAAFSASGDIIASGAIGATGLDNTNAWIVLEDPDGNRQIKLYRSTNGYRWYWRYSKGKKFALHGVGDGIALTIDATGTPNIVLTDSAGEFTSDVVGKNITIIGAINPANDGTYPITAQTATTVTYTNAGGVTENFAGTWHITDGTAVTSPSADDDKSFSLNRSVSFVGYPSSGSYYMHIVAEGDTPDGNVYPFWTAMRYTATGNPWGFIMMDCIDDSLSPAADSDKALLASSANQALGYNSGTYFGYGSPNSYLSGFMRYGEANEEWNAFGYLNYYLTGAVVCPNALGSNPEDTKYAVLPNFVARTGGIVNGMKGQSNLTRWKPINTFGYGDVVYDGTDYFLVIDETMLRGWPDSTGPTI